MARRIKQRVFSGSIAQNLASYGTNLAYNAAGAIGAQSFTASVWVKASSETIALGGTHNVFRYAGLLLSQNAATLFVYIDGVIRHTDTTFFPPRANRWVHLTVVCNNAANTISVYSDGELVTATSAVPAWNISVSQTTEIGSNTFTGMGVGSNVARTRLWVGIAMTASQVAALHYDDIDPNSALKVVDAGFSELAGTTMVNGGTLGGTFSFPVVGGWSTDAPGCQVRNALQNLLPQSNVFTNAAWQQLSLTASVSPLAHPTRPGANVYRLTEPVSAATPHLIRQLPVTTTALSGRVVHWTAKVRGGGGRAFVAIFGNGGAWGAYVQLSNGAVTSAPNALSYSVIDLGSSWYQVDVVGVSDGTQASIYLASASGVVTYAGDGSYIDVCDAQYRILDTAADYLDTTTYAVLAGGQGKPQQQNLAVNSEFASAASGWFAYNSALTSAAGVLRMTESVGVAEHGTYQNLSLAYGQTNTIGVEAKAGTRSWLRLRGALAASQSAYFNLATGAIGTVTAGCKAAIEACGDGYFRCSLTSLSVTNPEYMVVTMTTGDNVGSYNGDGSSYLDVRRPSWTLTNTWAEYVSTPVGSNVNNAGTPRGQAPEENLIARSEDLTLWTTLTSVTASQNGDAGLAGSTTTRLYETAANSYHYALQAMSATMDNQTIVTVSADLKAGSGVDAAAVQVNGGPQLIFNLSTGAFIYAAGTGYVSHSIESLGSGWYRASITCLAGSARQMMINTSLLNGTTAYPGNAANYMLVGRCQYTRSVGISPYVKTTTVALTGEGTTRGQVAFQNFLLYSEDYTQAAWTKQAGTVVTPNDTAAPDGTMTASTIDVTAAAANQGIFQVAPVAAVVAQAIGQTLTRSVWVKGTLGETVKISDPSMTTGTTTVTFTGAWQRESLSEAALIGGSGIWLRKGTASTFKMWGAQISSTQGLAPYVRTGAVATTGGIQTPRSQIA